MSLSPPDLCPIPDVQSLRGRKEGMDQHHGNHLKCLSLRRLVLIELVRFQTADRLVGFCDQQNAMIVFRSFIIRYAFKRLMFARLKTLSGQFLWSLANNCGVLVSCVSMIRVTETL